MLIVGEPCIYESAKRGGVYIPLVLKSIGGADTGITGNPLEGSSDPVKSHATTSTVSPKSGLLGLCLGDRPVSTQVVTHQGCSFIRLGVMAMPISTVVIKLVR